MRLRAACEVASRLRVLQHLDSLITYCVYYLDVHSQVEPTSLLCSWLPNAEVLYTCIMIFKATASSPMKLMLDEICLECPDVTLNRAI